MNYSKAKNTLRLIEKKVDPQFWSNVLKSQVKSSNL